MAKPKNNQPRVTTRLQNNSSRAQPERSINNGDTCEDTVKELQDELDKKASAYETLQAQLRLIQQQNCSMVKLTKKYNVIDYNEGDVAMIVESTKRIIYPKCQYINSKVQLSTIMRILFKHPWLVLRVEPSEEK